jgi:hypothetical protein
MRRPSPAMVVALIALFVALGGGAYAALKLPKGSVGTKQLKKGAVTPPKLAASTLKKLKGKTGPPGSPGAPGAPGTPGQDGAAGPAGPGAKLFTAEPVASATDAYVQLGKAGPFTLHTRCRISGGTVDAALIVTGPALTLDAVYVSRASGSGTVTLTDSDIEATPTIASPVVIGGIGSASGGKVGTAWTSALLQSNSSVAVQSWVRAESAGGELTDSCRITAIVTPLE